MLPLTYHNLREDLEAHKYTIQDRLCDVHWYMNQSTVQLDLWYFHLWQDLLREPE